MAELRVPGGTACRNARPRSPSGSSRASSRRASGRRCASFRGVEHRLEPVALEDGVRYVNDSQGTQPDAVIAALRSFDPPLVLIAGGRAKGAPTDELVAGSQSGPLRRCSSARAGPPWRPFRAAGLDSVERRRPCRQPSRGPTPSHASLLAEGAPEPATVLLSPAAASFDMFQDYAARGRAFKAAVSAVIADRRGGGSTS